MALKARLFNGLNQLSYGFLDCVCYRVIKDMEDTLILQKNIDRLGIWARKWGMRFQPLKCNMMQLTNLKL